MKHGLGRGQRRATCPYYGKRRGGAGRKVRATTGYFFEKVHLRLHSITMRRSDGTNAELSFFSFPAYL
jgi:hypothetical protein